ncbi:MAG: chromosomal replication initiator protein DnaA [Caldilineaceae bacterium SB0670_bin_27]|uniref:Chromosomal replication initiator protein DnaA n=1 Tax=Caldilineaceae bacterium SB0664_bin_27 TaxID=2605260 RepID=A0A6B0YR04_9CHLR|nr:chromosomal replication initiator protein DnaA [Caldilineaceae bacterium SB0664_bin_27]MYJ78494.1 chromosomal replication initiator protein DnaA [Caldilineaceae bacterium SB0670_bin_27]
MNTDWQSVSSSRRSDNPLYERAQSSSPRSTETPPEEQERAEQAEQSELQTEAAFADEQIQAVNADLNLEDIWQKTLHELALQMPATTFETWVRDTSIIGYKEGEFIVGAPHAWARDWLQSRLRNKIKGILSQLTGRSVQVSFEVRPQPQKRSESPGSAPLYADVPHAAPEATPETMSKPAQVSSTVAGSANPASRVQTNPQRRHDVAQTPAAAAVTKSDTALQGGVFNPRYTFDTFVVGNHNRLAHAAAQSIVEQPGHRFNPLFVYGGVGLGKTHLLHAIGHAMSRHGMQVLYCSSEQFTNDLISAIRQQNTEEYRSKYRQVDLLLIDDIQFIGGKESTQEEFFHTFNHLHAGGRQVVISSDRPPKEIATLEARLRSRFEGGLQADISQPDLETRVAILQSKAQSINQTISTDVLMLIAERVESNIRELEGALNRLIIQAPFHNRQLDRFVAESILDTLVPQRRPREAASVVRIVARHFHLTEETLLGRSRTKEVANARQMAMYLLREENGLSLINIGELLGGRDHSTVRHGVEKVAQDIERDEGVRREVVALREKIYEPPGS